MNELVKQCQQHFLVSFPILLSGGPLPSYLFCQMRSGGRLVKTLGAGGHVLALRSLDQRGTFHCMLLSVFGPLLNYGDKPGHQQAGKFSVTKCDACFMYVTVQVHCVLAPHLGCNHVI